MQVIDPMYRENRQIGYEFICIIKSNKIEIIVWVIEMYK